MTSRKQTSNPFAGFTTRRLLAALPLAALTLPLAPDAQALNRTWIGGNADWNALSANWNPADEPDSDDTAIFNTPNSVDMTIDNTIIALTMSGGIDLFTQDQFLDVNGNISLSGAGTSLTVGFNNILGVPVNALDAEDITIASGTTLSLGGSRIDTIAAAGEGVLTINSGGTFVGNGTVSNVDGIAAATNIFNNNGTLSVSNILDGFIIIGATPTARTLTFNASDPEARMNLDGTTDNGVVNVFRNQTLDINVELADTFNGDLNLFHNSTLNIEDAWTLGAGGTIDVDNGFIAGTFPFPDVPADVAFIQGGQFTQSGGTIDVVDADGTLHFQTGYTFNGGVLDNSAGGTVIFDANTTINDGSDYQLGVNSQTIIDSATVTVNDNNFNMDGTGGSDWTIRDGGRLNLRGTELDGDDIHGGTVIFDGTGVNILDIDTTNASELRSVQVRAGTGEIFSNSNDNITLGGSVNAFAGATIRLDSDFITFSGAGSLVGAGTAVFEEPVVVADDTTFSVNTLDIDNFNGQLTVNPGATLTVTSDSIEQVNSLFLINAAVADVSTSYSFGSGGTLQLLEFGVGVAPTYTGTGTVTFNNGSVLTNSDNAATFDADGVFNEGSIIRNTAAAAILTVGGAGETITLAGGDIEETVAGSRVVTGGTWLVTGESDVNVTTFDWDQATTRVATGGDLDINVTNIDVGNDRHDSTIQFEGGIVNVDVAANQWLAEGILRSNGGGSLFGDRVLIGDGAGTLDADVDVNTGVFNIGAPATFNSDADVDVAAGATLNITNSGTIFQPFGGIGVNGQFTGQGLMRVVGATFNEITTFDMTGGTVALDGSLSGNGGLFILTAGDNTLNAQLNINAAAVEDYGFTTIIGFPSTSELHINNSGSLIVNLDNPADDWRILSSGVINYNGDIIQGTILGGNAQIDFDGTLNVNGDGTVFNRVDIGGTFNINDVGERLRLDGGTIADPNTIDGGVINGPGNLVAIAGNALSGFGTINAAVDFEGNSELIASGGVLEVNTGIVDLGTLRANGGTLQLDTNTLSSVTQNGISLSNGVLTGSGIVTLDVRNLRGNGTVFSRVINNNTITAQNGTLIINDTLTDLDGGGAGIIRAQTGNLNLINVGDNTFTGTANIDATREIFQSDSFNIVAGGVLNFNGAGSQFRTDTSHAFSGTMNVNGNGAVDTDGGAVFTITSAATVNANANLDLQGNVTVQSGATISGGGSVTVDQGTTTLESGVTVSTLLINDSNLQIAAGNGTGNITVQDFDQNATGTLNVDLAGTNLNQFDRMAVAGSAFLAGELDVDVLFAAALGDLFPIMTGLNFNGTFDTLDVSGLGAGLDVFVNYNPTSVVLEIINAVSIVGDYNGSGQVEQGDLDLVLQNWGDNTPPIPAGWVNDLPVGQIEQSELDKVLQNWGNTSAPPNFAGSNVPEPGTAALLALSGLALMRRRSA